VQCCERDVTGKRGQCGAGGSGGREIGGEGEGDGEKEGEKERAACNFAVVLVVELVVVMVVGVVVFGYVVIAVDVVRAATVVVVIVVMVADGVLLVTSFSGETESNGGPVLCSAVSVVLMCCKVRVDDSTDKSIDSLASRVVMGLCIIT
jgi:hypothetical protein